MVSVMVMVMVLAIVMFMFMITVIELPSKLSSQYCIQYCILARWDKNTQLEFRLSGTRKEKFLCQQPKPLFLGAIWPSAAPALSCRACTRAHPIVGIQLTPTHQHWENTLVTTPGKLKDTSAFLCPPVNHNVNVCEVPPTRDAERGSQTMSFFSSSTIDPFWFTPQLQCHAISAGQVPQLTSQEGRGTWLYIC